MRKVIIKNLQGYQTHAGIFPSQEAAESWVQQNRQSNSWGLDERWVNGSLLNDSEKQSAIEQRTDTIGGTPVTSYKLRAQYTVEITGQSFEENVEAELLYRRKARVFGNDLIDYIAVVNESKGLSLSDLTLVLANQQVQLVSEFLKTGSLIYARGIIMAMDESIYSASEKASVIQKIETFLLANGRLFT